MTLQEMVNARQNEGLAALQEESEKLAAALSKINAQLEPLLAKRDDLAQKLVGVEGKITNHKKTVRDEMVALLESMGLKLQEDKPAAKPATSKRTRNLVIYVDGVQATTPGSKDRCPTTAVRTLESGIKSVSDFIAKYLDPQGIDYATGNWKITTDNGRIVEGRIA